MENLGLLNIISIKCYRPGFLVVLKQTIDWIKTPGLKGGGEKSLNDQIVILTADISDVAFVSMGSFSLVRRKLATSICLAFRVGMKRSPPTLFGVHWVFPFLPLVGINTFTWIFKNYSEYKIYRVWTCNLFHLQSNIQPLSNTHPSQKGCSTSAGWNDRRELQSGEELTALSIGCSASRGLVGLQSVMTLDMSYLYKCI